MFFIHIRNTHPLFSSKTGGVGWDALATLPSVSCRMPEALGCRSHILNPKPCHPEPETIDLHLTEREALRQTIDPELRSNHRT